MSDAIHHPFATPPAEGQAQTVAPGILWMRLALPKPLGHVNVYALDGGDEGWTVVDTGLWSPAAEVQWLTLLAGPLGGRPVARVLVTHHHPDHVGMAGWFQARGASLWMTRTAWLYARMLTLDVQTGPSAQAMAFWRAAGLPDAALARRAGERPFNFADVVHPLPPGFHRLSEGQVLDLAGRRWVVRLGQGHAPDHATLWADDVVLGADQMLPGISANIGVYATEPDADPLSEWLDSCTALAVFSRDDLLVLPGHKLPYHGLWARLDQMVRHHADALRDLLAFLDAPRTAFDCFAVLFARPIGPGEEGLALAEAIAHLNHLRQKGLVRRKASPEGVWLWQKGAE